MKTTSVRFYTKEEKQELSEILPLKGDVRHHAMREFCDRHSRSYDGAWFKMTHPGKGRKYGKRKAAKADVVSPVLKTVAKITSGVITVDLEEIVIRGNKLMIYYR